MKKRLLGLGTSIVVITCCLIIGGTFALGFNQSETQRFLELVSEHYNYQFTPKELKEYEMKIEQELANAEMRTSLSEIYYALGKVAALQEKYEKSNVNLLNALTLSDEINLELKVKIYQELATNYIELKDVDNGYRFFEMANEYVHQLNNNRAKVSLYSDFSRALIFNTDHTSFPSQLMSQVSDLVEDSYHQVNIRLLLSLIYKKGGQYELSLNELIRALDICVTNQYLEFEREILGKIGVLYCMTGYYQESNEILDRYFELVDHQMAIPCVGIRLQNNYLLHGYEKTLKDIQLLEEDLAKYSEEVTEGYDLLKHFILIYVYLQEERYEDGLKEIEQLELIKENRVTAPTTDLWLEKLKLDIQYQKDEKDIKYLESYQNLFYKILHLNEVSDGKFVLLQQVMNTLVSMEDYETVYHYMSTRQSTLSNELTGLSSLTEVILNQKVSETPAQKWDFTLSLTFILYSLILMVFGGLIYAFYRHINRIKALKRLIQKSQGIDPLTQTLTKEELYQQLEFECGPFKEFYFLVIDIDEFSSYNESFGYLAGNKILKEIANILTSHFPDAYISRHLGKQFIIVTEYEDDEKLRNMITSVMKEMETNPVVTERRVLTFSIGVSKGVLKNILDIDEHIKLASKKLDISKQRGKGICTM